MTPDKWQTTKGMLKIGLAGLIAGALFNDLIKNTQESLAKRDIWMYPALLFLWVVFGLPMMIIIGLLVVGLLGMVGYVFIMPWESAYDMFSQGRHAEGWGLVGLGVFVNFMLFGVLYSVSDRKLGLTICIVIVTSSIALLLVWLNNT